MPVIMELDGPRLGAIDRIRGELYAAAPRSWWRTQAQLGGVLDPLTAHPFLVLAGIIGGAWWAMNRRPARRARRR